MNDLKQELRKELEYLLFIQREEDFVHSPIQQEQKLYHAIQAGNLELVKELGSQFTGEMGILSDDKVRNAQYHFAIGLCLITRYCVQAGMDAEEAYTRSDVFIRKADKLRKTEEIYALYLQAIEVFTKKMKVIQDEHITSAPVQRAKKYIEKHLTDSINVESTAHAIGVHPDYLSKVFKQHMGLSFTDYVKLRRVNVSKSMLLESDASCTEIAYFLGFSSGSHYITAFKKFVNMTPGEYRKKPIDDGLL